MQGLELQEKGGEKKKKKMKEYKKSVWKKPIVKRCLLILVLKPFIL